MEASLLDDVVSTAEEPSCVVGSIVVDQMVEAAAVCSTVEVVVEVASLVVSTVEDPSSPVGAMDVDETVVCSTVEDVVVAGMSVVGSSVANASAVVCGDNSVVSCAKVVVFQVEEEIESVEASVVVKVGIGSVK